MNECDGCAALSVSTELYKTLTINTPPVLMANRVALAPKCQPLPLTADPSLPLPPPPPHVLLPRSSPLPSQQLVASLVIHHFLLPPRPPALAKASSISSLSSPISSKPSPPPSPASRVGSGLLLPRYLPQLIASPLITDAVDRHRRTVMEKLGFYLFIYLFSGRGGGKRSWPTFTEGR